MEVEYPGLKKFRVASSEFQSLARGFKATRGIKATIEMPAHHERLRLRDHNVFADDQPPRVDDRRLMTDDCPPHHPIFSRNEVTCAT